MNEQEEKLRQYLDGELTSEEEGEVLHMIADDPEMRSMLRFERKLSSAVNDIYNDKNEAVPANFSDRVLTRIESLKTFSEPERKGVLGSVKELIWMPRRVAFRPAYAVAAVVLLLASFSLPFYLAPVEQQETTEGLEQSVQQVSESVDQVWLRFVYIDKEAESVAVAGDFSNWEPIALDQQMVNGEQVWTGLVSMSRGEHRYMFVKDGEKWVTDPLATVQREDGFGNKNAVIYL